MIRLARIAVLACALTAAAPASAQYTFTQPGQQPQPVQQLQVWNNVARVNLGVSFYNSTYWNCFYWGWTVSLQRGRLGELHPLHVRSSGRHQPFGDEQHQRRVQRDAG